MGFGVKPHCHKVVPQFEASPVITIIVTDRCRFGRVGYNNDSAKQADKTINGTARSESMFATILGGKLAFAFAA